MISVNLGVSINTVNYSNSKFATVGGGAEESGCVGEFVVFAFSLVV